MPILEICPSDANSLMRSRKMPFILPTGEYRMLTFEYALRNIFFVMFDSCANPMPEIEAIAGHDSMRHQ